MRGTHAVCAWNGIQLDNQFVESNHFEPLTRPSNLHLKDEINLPIVNAMIYLWPQIDCISYREYVRQIWLRLVCCKLMSSRKSTTAVVVLNVNACMLFSVKWIYKALIKKLSQKAVTSSQSKLKSSFMLVSHWRRFAAQISALLLLSTENKHHNYILVNYLNYSNKGKKYFAAHLNNLHFYSTFFESLSDSGNSKKKWPFFTPNTNLKKWLIIMLKVLIEN